MDGSNLVMIAEIMQSKHFKKLLAKNSEYLKKLAKESEGEIIKIDTKPVKKKNISCFNQCMFKNVKKKFISDNDINITKEMISGLLIKVE